MLETYMMEIMAAVVILVLLLIYFVVKKSKNKKVDTTQTQDEDESKEIEVVVTKREEEPKSEEKPKDFTDLSGGEEGSFGLEDVQTIEDSEDNLHKELHRVKRDVPPHDKITKNDFKEFAGKRILVAEDNLINQKVINGLLADTGIEITMADDGQIALDILVEDSDYDFILMDAHMPRVDGFEATRAIRAISKYNHIVIIALSGDTAADDIKNMTNAGMEEHLEKPLRMDALYDILYTYALNKDATKETESVVTDGFIEIMVTEELDADKGLNICGDDEEFYNEILDEFINTYTDSPAKLREYLSSGKMKEADKYLFDLGGITANIGAIKINNIIVELKEAISNKNGKKVNELYKEYIQSLRNLLKDIKKYKNI